MHNACTRHAAGSARSGDRLSGGGAGCGRRRGVGQERGMATEHLVPEDIRAALSRAGVAERGGRADDRLPGRVGGHRRGAARLPAAALGDPDRGRRAVADLAAGQRRLRGARLARGEVRDPDRRRRDRVCQPDACGRLLQGAGGGRARVEQQGSVLRPRPQQLPAAVRPAGDRRRGDPDARDRAAGGVRPARQGVELRGEHDPPREALAADRGRRRRRLPGADLRDHARRSTSTTATRRWRRRGRRRRRGGARRRRAGAARPRGGGGRPRRPPALAGRRAVGPGPPRAQSRELVLAACWRDLRTARGFQPV